MSVIATAVKHLLAAGVTGDALLAAIADMEAQAVASAVADLRAEIRAEVMAETKARSTSAERMARKRARDRQASELSQVTLCDGDVTQSDAAAKTAPLSLPPNENNSNPPTHTPEQKTTGAHDVREAGPIGAELASVAAGLPQAATVVLVGDDAPAACAAAGSPSQSEDVAPAKSKPAAKRKRASAADGEALPDGWQPVLTPKAQELVKDWPAGMFERELLAFEGHAHSNGRTTKDWQAAFRSWLTIADRRRAEHAEQSTRSPAHRQPFARNHGTDHRDGFQRACDEKIFGLAPAG